MNRPTRITLLSMPLVLALAILHSCAAKAYFDTGNALFTSCTSSNLFEMGNCMADFSATRPAL